MLLTSRRLSALAFALTTVVAPAATAQDVQYTTVTKVDLGGAMNAMMRMAGGNEFRETTYIKGKKLRSEDDKRATIFDLENGRYIVIDKEAKTYTSVPIADWAAVATAPVRGMRAEASNDQLKGTAVDSAGNKADFVVDLKVEPTNQRRDINGHSAERMFVTMETNIHVTPQGQTQSEEAGTLVVLMDTWNAKTGPASDAVRAWEQAASNELAAAAFGGRGNLGPAMAANPGMADAMKKAREEAQKAEGVAVLSTMHLVVVAPKQKFNRALALGESEGGAAPQEQRRGGFRGMIGKAIESQRAQQKEAKSEEQATQGTFAKVRTEMRDIRTTSLPDNLFEVPAGYREVKAETTR